MKERERGGKGGGGEGGKGGGGEGERGEGERGERGGKGGRGRGILPVVTRCTLPSPVVTSCRSLLLVINCRHPLLPVVTRRHRCHPSSTDVIRRHPSNPSSSPSPLPSPPTFLEITTDHGGEFNNFGGFIQSKIHIFAEYYPISFIYRLKPSQDVYQPISRRWFQSGLNCGFL